MRCRETQVLKYSLQLALMVLLLYCPAIDLAQTQTSSTPTAQTKWFDYKTAIHNMNQQWQRLLVALRPAIDWIYLITLSLYQNLLAYVSPEKQDSPPDIKPISSALIQEKPADHKPKQGTP